MIYFVGKFRGNQYLLFHEVKIWGKRAHSYLTQWFSISLEFHFLDRFFQPTLQRDWNKKCDGVIEVFFSINFNRLYILLFIVNFNFFFLHVPLNGNNNIVHFCFRSHFSHPFIHCCCCIFFFIILSFHQQLYSQRSAT